MRRGRRWLTLLPLETIISGGSQGPRSCPSDRPDIQPVVVGGVLSVNMAIIKERKCLIINARLIEKLFYRADITIIMRRDL